MSGKFSKIQWGDGLAVTDEGDGVIRVDGSGGTGPPGATGPAGPTGPTGPAGPPGTGGLPAHTVVAPATRIISNILAAGDTQPAWRILGSGKQEWGPSGTTAPDTNFYRELAGRLCTDGQFIAQRGGPGQVQIGAGAVAGMSLGSAADVGIYRFGANILRTDGTFMPAPSAGTPLFALDIGPFAGGSPTIANNATAQPFGGPAFSGLFIVEDAIYTGCLAVFLTGAGAITLVAQVGSFFTTVAGTAGKINVYLSSSVVTIENKMGGTIAYNVMAFRTRLTQ